MPDNSQKIARIERILQAGATNVSIDGTTTNYDFAELRRQLDELRATDTSQVNKRPMFFGIDLSKAR